MSLTRTLQGNRPEAADGLAADSRHRTWLAAEQLARTRLSRALDLLSGSAKRLELQRNRLVQKLNEFLAEQSSEALAMKLADLIDELEDICARGDSDLDTDAGTARPGQNDSARAQPLLRWWHIGAEPPAAGAPPPAPPTGHLTAAQTLGARAAAPGHAIGRTGSVPQATVPPPAATRRSAAMAVLCRTVGEALAAGGAQGFGTLQIMSLPPYARIPSGKVTTDHRTLAARNINGLLARGGGDIFDYLLATQTTAMMKALTVDDHAACAGWFADPLSVNELAYMGEFLPDSAFVRAETLSAERLEDAQRRYGTTPRAAHSLANHLNRQAILDHVRASMELSADQDRARAPSRLDAARLSAQQARDDGGISTPPSEATIRAAAARFAGLLSVLGPQVLSYRTGMTLGHGGACGTPAGHGQGIRSHAQCQHDLVGGRLQAERLNADAAYEGALDAHAAFSVALPSAALADAAAAGQARFLAGMERFWSLFRAGSGDVREGRRPTNADYGAALEVALQEAGYTAQDARPLAAVARSERVLNGLLDLAPVPIVPAGLAG